MGGFAVGPAVVVDKFYNHLDIVPGVGGLGFVERGQEAGGFAWVPLIVYWRVERAFPVVEQEEAVVGTTRMLCSDH